MMAKSCSGCAHAFRTPGSVRFPGALVCRRYPPTQILVPDPMDKSGVNLRTTLPAVDDDFWCGEFKEKMLVTVITNDYVEKTA